MHQSMLGPSGKGGGAGGGGLDRPSSSEGWEFRHEMNAQGSGNSTYFILLSDVKTGSGCLWVGN